MKLEELIIRPQNSYSPVGPDNPYQATIRVSYDDNKMQVALSPEATRKVMMLCKDEIGAAAQVQMDNFVETALAYDATPLIEGE
jgi:hypothetical protein